jgi:hypothetical protein
VDGNVAKKINSGCSRSSKQDYLLAEVKVARQRLGFSERQTASLQRVRHRLVYTRCIFSAGILASAATLSTCTPSMVTQVPCSS